jgi:POT family proton-dependent oligopeptide transporter
LTLAARLSTFRSGFARTFWVANTLELFERLAFYAAKAVLAVYLAETLGLGTLGNDLAGYYGFAVFFLPVFAGTIVDRYGFKKSLAACFSIFSLGYFAIGLGAMPLGQPLVAAVGVKAYAVGALLLTAIGGSLIKPCIVGTVARTTTEDTKSLGYSIYYTLVNIGGFLGPFLAPPVRENFGIQSVLVMSSLVSLLNLLATLLFFHEPEGGPTGPRRTFGTVLKDMVLVFRNGRFISFLVIFSGFWIMFWQIFYALPFFVRDVLHFDKFELIEAVDALAIFLLTVVIAALTKKLRPILAMSIGFAIASASWLLIAARPSFPVTVFAIVIFAIGEMMQAPRFYEYVADLAPRAQVGTFMGFAFLPVAIGSLIAGRLSGYLVQHFVRETQNPTALFVTISSVGFASTALMLLYDRFVAPRPAA